VAKLLQAPQDRSLSASVKVAVQEDRFLLLVGAAATMVMAGTLCCLQVKTLVAVMAEAAC
jgi:hypothetical protein